MVPADSLDIDPTDGSFLTGTFADYLLPTTREVPDPLILHMQTPSPFTPTAPTPPG